MTPSAPKRARPVSARTPGKKPVNETHGVDTVWPKRQLKERRQSNVMVVPLARGLAVLSAFRSRQEWMGNLEIATATGIPAPTVSRLLKSLVTLGFLRRDEARRMYSLAPAVLGLGYGAVSDEEVQRIASTTMQAFAETTDTYVVLAARDGLDVVILGTYASPRTMIDLPLLPGTRAHLAYALTGSALIAALPEAESNYLRAALKNKTGSDWPVLRQRISGNVSQVRELGFCMLRGEWSPDLAVVSTPLLLSNRPPLALSCVGRVSRVAHEHMERKLGPRLVAMAQVVRKLVEQD